MNATPHVSQKQNSAIDARTTRHPGYAISQQQRKRVEEIFGWTKTVGGMRKPRHRGCKWWAGCSPAPPLTTWFAFATCRRQLPERTYEK